MSFRIFGVNFYISFFFYVGICLILLTDKSKTALPVLAGVIAHETAHLITMKRLNCLPKNVAITLGGFDIIGNRFVSYNEQILISVTGPLINLIGALFFYIGYYLLNKDFLLIWNVCWLLLGIINLLPVNGLDGGTILLNILLKFSKPHLAKTLIKIISISLALSFIILTVLISLTREFNVSFTLFGVYLILSSILKI